MVITDFLKMGHSKEELVIALDILKKFKSCESEERKKLDFGWVKFEQFEEFLEHLVNGKELKDDTQRYIKRTEKEQKMERELR